MRFAPSVERYRLSQCSLSLPEIRHTWWGTWRDRFFLCGLSLPFIFVCASQSPSSYRKNSPAGDPPPPRFICIVIDAAGEYVEMDGTNSLRF